jgi:hypothetical protein
MQPWFWLLSFWLLLGINQAQAQLPSQQQFEKQSGDYTVYYSLFPSSFLQADIAASYGIIRARDRAILNISVRHTTGSGSEAQSALVKGTSSDLIHSRRLEFQEIREQDAVYYLAEVRVSNQATLYFDLQVQPDPNAPAIELRFNKEVFPE